MIPASSARLGAAHARWRRWRSTGRTVRGTVGRRGVMLLALQRAVPRRLVHVEWFSVLELLTADPQPLPPDGDVRWATAADEELLTSLGGDAEVVRARLAAGDGAAVCVRGGRLVGHVYVRSGSYDEQGMIVRLGEDERWLYDGVVDPDSRGTGVYPHLVRAVARDLAASGVPRLLSAVDRLNTASLRSARRRGGTAIGSVTMVRILGLCIRREDWNGEVRHAVHRGTRDLVPPPVESARRRPITVGRGG